MTSFLKRDPFSPMDTSTNKPRHKVRVSRSENRSQQQQQQAPPANDKSSSTAFNQQLVGELHTQHVRLGALEQIVQGMSLFWKKERKKERK
jgi:hypothetical protein